MLLLALKKLDDQFLRFRLYIKQHFSHPSLIQSVAIKYIIDGLTAPFILAALTY
jgi:hypothetical protein